MSTSLQVESAELRASGQLTASFVASTVYTFTKLPRSASLAITYTRASGVAGYAEMTAEVSADKTTWYRYSANGTLSISAPSATGPVYLAVYSLPAPSSDDAIRFIMPLTMDGGMPHIRFRFREASGLTAGTLAATLHITQESV